MATITVKNSRALYGNTEFQVGLSAADHLQGGWSSPMTLASFTTVTNNTNGGSGKCLQQAAPGKYDHFFRADAMTLPINVGDSITLS